MNDNDYPAAHSMDTDWFAVDKNGYVAVFTSFEAGAVPRQYDENFGDDAISMDALNSALARNGSAFRQNLQVLLKEPILLNGKIATWEELPEKSWRVVVRHVANTKHVSGQVTVPEGIFSTTFYTSKHEVLKKYDSGEFTHVWVETDLMTLCGFFTYAHGDKWENWISGPYERDGTPQTPIRIADLPTAMSKCPVRLPKNDFKEDPRIQPVDSMPCESWQNAYVSIDEKTIRPMPPNTDFDDEILEALKGQGFTFDPPIDEAEK